MKRNFGISTNNNAKIMRDFNYLFKGKTVKDIQIKGIYKNEYGYTQIMFECEVLEEETNE